MSIRPDDIAAKWEEMGPVIDRLQCAGPGLFDVEPGSRLAEDDSDRGGYPTSHAARWCAAAAIDYLHAVKMLVVDARVHHLYASSTLARSAIETAATGLWILWPDDNAIRVERCIQWWCQNALGSHKAIPDEDRRDVLGALTRGVSNANRLRNGYRMTHVVEWVDANVDPLHGVGPAWRLSSGFAHGRPWAVIGAQNREASVGPDSASDIYEIVTLQSLTRRTLNRDVSGRDFTTDTNVSDEIWDRVALSVIWHSLPAQTLHARCQ